MMPRSGRLKGCILSYFYPAHRFSSLLPDNAFYWQRATGNRELVRTGEELHEAIADILDIADFIIRQPGSDTGFRCRAH